MRGTMGAKEMLHARDGFVPLRGEALACFDAMALRCEARSDGDALWVPAWLAELMVPLWDHESCAGRVIVAWPTPENTERLARFLGRCQRNFTLRDAALVARRGDTTGNRLVDLFNRTEKQ